MWHSEDIQEYLNLALVTKVAKCKTMSKFLFLLNDDQNYYLILKVNVVSKELSKGGTVILR